MNTFYNSFFIGTLSFFSFIFLEKDTTHFTPQYQSENFEVDETITNTPNSFSMVCSPGTNEVKFVQCYDQTNATLDTDRNDYFVCCAPPTWSPSQAYEFDAVPIENDYPCTAGANIDGMKLTITINSVSFDWSNYPCCELYLEGVYANLYDNCLANTCTVLGDGLDSSSPGMGDCSANGENLNFDPVTGNFVLPLPYTSVTDCIGPFFNTNESLGIDIVPSIKYDEANANGCNCPPDAISQGVITVDYDIEIEYTFCESDLPLNCAQVSFASIGTLCENDPILNLPTTSDEGISGSWNPSSINPSGQGGSTVQATFTPNVDCEPTVTLNIEIEDFVTPTFNPLADVCESDPLVPLQTTSNEGVVGTWDVGDLFDPSQYPGQTVTLNFTPDAGECASTQTLNITVLEESTPTFFPIGPVCESDSPIFLPSTSQEGFTGNWQNGQNTFDPFGFGGQTVTLTFFTDPDQCAESQATIDIQVNSEVEPTFAQVSALCENDPPFQLPTTSLEGIAGTWNPSAIDPFGEGGNSITSTFTPNGGECASTTTMTVFINASTDPTFDPVGPLCETDDPVTLPTTSLEGVPGTWVPATIDPSGQGGNVLSAEFTPNGGECATVTFLGITVETSTTPTFQIVSSLCESDDILTLPTFSDEGIEGTWSPSEIDPNGQGGNIITATFTPLADECATIESVDVEITAEITPSFDPINSLCEDDDPVNLSNSNDGITGTWDVGTTLDPTGLGGTVQTITFTPDPDQCAGVYTEDVTIHNLPTMEEMEKECNAGLADYFVNIETNGTDVASSDGIVTNNMDGTFTIDQIPAGTDISLTITDTNTGCEESYSITSPVCNCPPIDPPTGDDVTICENEPIPPLTASASGNLEIDWYDEATGGTLLLENSTTYTPSQAGIYYVEAVDGMSECTSTDRTAIELIIIQLDTVFDTAPTCDPNLVGLDTMVFSTAECDSVVILETILSPSSEEMVMASTCDPNLAGIDTLILMNQFGCDSTIITETILQNDIETLIPLTTCDPMMVGSDTTIFQTQNCDSIVIVETTLLPSSEEMTMDFTCEPNEAGFDTLYLTNQFGCDSVVIIETILNPSQEFSFTENTCDMMQVGLDTSFLTNQFGCDSLIITETILAPSQEMMFTESSCNINDVGIDTLFLTNQFNCDSLIITETIFSAADTTFRDTTTCDISLVGIDTLVFNTADCDSIVILTTDLLPPSDTIINVLTCDVNQVGMETIVLINQFGCDSTVLTVTDLAPATETPLNAFSCDPNEVGFDTLTLTNQFGCDSLIITETIFSPLDPTFDNAQTCNINEVGVDTLIFNSGNCDSTVILTTTLLPSSQSFENDLTCDPNEVGIDTVVLVNFNGCDSLVITNTDLAPSNETPLLSFSCNLNEVGFDTVFLNNQFGCDSLVITETQFLPITPTLENATTCEPSQVGLDTMIINVGGCDSLIITNTILVDDSEVFLTAETCEPNEVGVDTVVLVNFNGCDSLVITTTSLNPSDEINLMSNTCEPAEVGFDTLFFSNQFGCDSLVITETILTPAVDGIEYQISPPTCNFPLGTIEIQAVSGGTGPYLYSIDGGNTFVSNTLFQDLPGGDYDVVIQDMEGCEFMETVNVPLPIEPFVTLDDEVTIELGESQILNAITNIPAANLVSIVWLPDTGLSCSDCLTPTASPTQSTTYLLTLTDDSGCVVSSEITIFVDIKTRFYIPNIFSPNGDGVNDNFMVFGNEKQIQEVRSFRVFSRWGDLLYEVQNVAPNDLSKGWNGETNGEELNAGVYMYKASIIFADGSTREVLGDVTLIR
jgi:gliding motility-associated-like protein